MNILDWIIGIIVTIGCATSYHFGSLSSKYPFNSLFLLGELEGSRLVPWAFRSFAGPQVGRNHGL